MSNLWVQTTELDEYADSDYADDAVKMASYLLWAMSGRKYSGTMTVTERYVTTYDLYGLLGGATGTYAPVLVSGTVHNIPVSRFGYAAQYDLLGDGTSSRSRVRLRGRKAVVVHALRDMSGNVIDPSEYYLGDHSTVYGAPNASWSPSNVEITYSYGTPPPSAGKSAARILAMEFVKMFEGDDTCALPQRVMNVTRQGVTYTFLDDQNYIDELKTGIYAVDLFLKTANPDKARARARVFSPDVPRARRITGKPFVMAPSAIDLFVNAGGGTITLRMGDIGASGLLTDPNWVYSAVVTNWAGDRTLTLANAPTLNTSVPLSETITVTADYAEILSILGPQDPGVLDVYATRPSLGNPLVDEVVSVYTSNIAIRMGQPLTSVYPY